MHKNFKIFKDKISQIPLFENLSQNDLENIFANSQILNFTKNNHIFSQNETAKNFYIIIEGQVKLFALNQEGQDSSILILKEGEILNDLFLDYFSLNSKAVENCKIFSFDLQDFRNKLTKYPNLAINLLLNLNSKNQKLLNHITKLKINNAKERLGEFLLEAAFEKKEKRQEFKLKYSKNEIASYLGIKPETLSRVLKQLKDDDEITIQNDKIILKKPKSLCSYCNKEITINCKNYNQEECGQ